MLRSRPSRALASSCVLSSSRLSFSSVRSLGTSSETRFASLSRRYGQQIEQHPVPRRRGLAKTLLGVTGVVLVVGGGGWYMRERRLQENAAITPDQYHESQQPGLDMALPKTAEDLRSTNFTFYRYTPCPFCGKVKAFLDYNSIYYLPIEVDPMFKSEIKHHGYTKVPQLQIGDQGQGPILVDSDKIVERLAKIVGMETEKGDIGLWRAWARERLVRFLVLNVNKSLSDAYEGYSYIDNLTSIPFYSKLFLKIAGTPVMYLVARYKTSPYLQKLNGEEFDSPKYGAIPGRKPYDPTADPLEILMRELKIWTEGLQDKTFHGGDLPDLADLDIYGVLQSVRGLQPYREACAQIPRLSVWLDKMEELLTERSKQMRSLDGIVLQASTSSGIEEKEK